MKQISSTKKTAMTLNLSLNLTLELELVFEFVFELETSFGQWASNEYRTLSVAEG